MKRKLLLSGAVLALLGVILGLLLYHGFLHFNNPSAKDYPIRGIDVSHYQGEIKWETIAEQNIRFAYIKATEGSTYLDPRFSENWNGVKETDLKYGAYHFFSYDSSGQQQAEHYIASVPRGGALPPAVDLEFYGDKEKNPPPKAEVQAQLQTMLEALQQHYGQKPMIYATEKSYRLYLEGDFPDADIWIRDVVKKPVLADGRKWTFW